MSDVRPISYHLRKVRTPGVSELILEQLKALIVKGAIKPGEQMPPERELIQQFQASRASVREALKKLEARGFVRIMRGSGVFVREINSEPISDSFSWILRVKKGRMEDLTEARSMFEPNVVKLACKTITPEGILELERNVQDTVKNIEVGSPGALEKNLQFHSLLAKLTNNPVVGLLMTALLDVAKNWPEEEGEPLQHKIEVDSRTIRYHQEILAAIKERDSEKASRLMLQHILKVQKDWNEIWSGDDHRKKRTKAAKKIE